MNIFRRHEKSSIVLFSFYCRIDDAAEMQTSQWKMDQLRSPFLAEPQPSTEQTHNIETETKRIVSMKIFTS